MNKRPRIGLRVCFLILTALAIVFGIHHNVRQSASRQRSMILRVEQEAIDQGQLPMFASANVSYDYGYSIVGGKSESYFDKNNSTFFGHRNVPKVLLDQMGVDYFYQVRAVSMPSVDLRNHQRLEVSRARIEQIIRDLDQLPGLEELSLATSGIRPDALDDLAELKKLRKVLIRDTTTAAHLERLADSSMTVLLLYGCVTDEQFIAISRATRLVELDMGLISESDAELTKVGIAAICELPNLRSLSISSHTLSSDAIGQLSKLDSLRDLRLGAPGVGGLHKAISAMPLRSLYVMDMNLCDRDLVAISQLKSLEELYIGDSTSTLTVPLSQLKKLVRSPSLRRIDLDGVVLAVAETRELAEAAGKLELLVVRSPLLSQSDQIELENEFGPPLVITSSFLEY